MAKKIFFAVSLAAGVAVFAYVIAGLGGIGPAVETMGRLGTLGLAVCGGGLRQLDGLSHHPG